MSNEELSKEMSVSIGFRPFEVPQFLFSRAEHGPRVGIPLGECDDAILEEACKRFRDGVFEIAREQRVAAATAKR